MFECQQPFVGVSAPPGFETCTFFRVYRVRGRDEELFQAWIVLGLDGQPEPGVLTVDPDSYLEAIGEVADEPRGLAAVAAVDDLDRAPCLGAGAVAAPYPIHRPLARIHRGVGQGMDLGRAVGAEPVAQRFTRPEQAAAVVERERAVLVDEMFERLLGKSAVAGELVGSTGHADETTH
ncbi:hypothetical protein [Nocardia gipuzkoensis]